MKLQSQIRVLSEAEMDSIFETAVDVVKSVLNNMNLLSKEISQM